MLEGKGREQEEIRWKDVRRWKGGKTEEKQWMRRHIGKERKMGTGGEEKGEQAMEEKGTKGE